MQLLDGKLVSQQILDSLKLKIENCKSKINLHVILVGSDPNSLKYVAIKEKRSREVGVDFTLHHLPEEISESDLIKQIGELNDSSEVTGFFIQLPLPKHINKETVLSQISVEKDVDGLNPKSSFIPAVVIGVMKLLDFYHLPLAEKNAVIINKSNLIGIPLEIQLISRNCHVTLGDINTKNLAKLSRGADILISATGVEGLVTADYIKLDAIVVDIGGGDVNFEAVKAKTSYITPTTGGIGPMTVTCLLENLVNIALK